MTRMAEKNWTRRVKIVEYDKVANGIREVAESWDEIGVDNVAYAIAEIADKIGFPADQVLTANQVKRLKDKGVL